MPRFRQQQLRDTPAVAAAASTWGMRWAVLKLFCGAAYYRAKAWNEKQLEREGQVDFWILLVCVCAPLPRSMQSLLRCHLRG